MKSQAPSTLLLSLFLAMAAPGVAQTATPAADSAGKTYTLFEGENISVGQGGALHPVRDVNGGSWVVVIDGQAQLVSAKNGPIAMKVTSSPKITDVSAEITHLKSERSYTFANDPAVQMTKNLNNGALVNIGEHTAANQATAVSNEAMVTATMSGGAKATDSTAAGASASNATLPEQGSTTAGGDLSLIGGQDEAGNFDQLTVNFDISAKRKLDEAYFVVSTKFRDRNAAPDAAQSLIYARALDPIDATGEHVKFEQAGFPPGYHLISFEIHVYNHGIEVATNVAPNRKVLSSEEAFDYVKTKYIEAHKGQTVAAAPIMGSLPDDLAAHIAEGKYGAAFYVRVSKDGLADGEYSDAACSARINDPYLDTVVSGIRFKPALADGSPVAGVATLNLSQLRI
jgi:hypothetical protein